MKRVAKWLPVVFGIAILATLVALNGYRCTHGINDFATFYAGGRLAGAPGLYSVAANDAMIRSILGTPMTITFIRPPFYAALMKPLTLLPYLAAYYTFCALCLASIIWFVARFSKECPELPLFASCSIPVAAFLLQGQDGAFLLVFLGAAIILARRKKDFACGLMLALCAIKFHLFIFVVLLLLIKRRWRTVAGGVCGLGILLVLGVVVAGVDSIAQYANLLRDPRMQFRIEFMPNIHGLVSSTWPGAPLEIGLTGAVAVGFVWACLRTENYEWLFALGLLCGLLVSYHSGIGDDILLLPVFALMVPSGGRLLHVALAVALSPLPYFTGFPVSIAVPSLLLLILVLALVALTRRVNAVQPYPAAA
jgi:hypothetical protein